VTSRNEPKANPKVFRISPDLFGTMDGVAVQDQIEWAFPGDRSWILLGAGSDQPIEIMPECFPFLFQMSRSLIWVFSPFLLSSADYSFWNVGQWQNFSLVRKFVPVREDINDDRLQFRFVTRISAMGRVNRL
jgi:hypothetical protein